jgi:hypothetical protein
MLEHFLLSKISNGPNKLECLLDYSNLVKYFWVRPRAYHRVQASEKAPALLKNVH